MTITLVAVIIGITIQLGVNALSQEEVTACLNAHNTLRQLHTSTPNLEWDNDLAAKAQVYAETLRDINKYSTKTQLIHENPSGGMGENLYWRDNKKLGTCAGASLSWYNEIDDYSYDTASSINGKAIGHFTQVVWKGTMKFGVGIATMDSRKYSQYGNTETFIVAKYSPPGNYYMSGQKLQYYTENVQPRKAGAVTPSLEELDPSQKQACENAAGDSSCAYFIGSGTYSCDGDFQEYFKTNCFKDCGYCTN